MLERDFYTLAQLFNYNMNLEEQVIWEQLESRVRRLYMAYDLPQEYKRYLNVMLKSDWEQRIGYRCDYGLYSVYCERGSYSMNNKLPIHNIDDAEFYFIEQVLWSVGSQIECDNRSDIKLSWRHSVEYDSRVHFFEYQIRWLSKIYGIYRCNDLIVKRIGNMNNWFNEAHWGFDEEEMVFIEVSDSKEHD